MGNETAMREQVIEELRQVPEDRLTEIYDLIHFFRLGLQSAQTGGGDVMRFAGAWAGMPEAQFEGFLAEIAARRATAFAGRRNDATGAD